MTFKLVDLDNHINIKSSNFLLVGEKTYIFYEVVSSFERKISTLQQNQVPYSEFKS